MHFSLQPGSAGQCMSGVEQIYWYPMCKLCRNNKFFNIFNTETRREVKQVKLNPDHFSNGNNIIIKHNADLF